MNDKPKVFISYAREDGEAFAGRLRGRLETEWPEIVIWQDRLQMEGGKDWWKQITDALDVVSFLILVMTPAAMRSRACRDEWQYARSQGVCVYPVMGAAKEELDFEKLPRWMSQSHFYDLDKEWDNFVGHLKIPCEVERVPFMAPSLPVAHVERPDELGKLLIAVCDRQENPIPGTVALHGAGGFGKTTLAAALCHHDDVITTFSSGILWVTLGENPELRAALTKLYAAMTGERPAFVDPEDAAVQLAEKLKNKNCLLILDDVWAAAHIKPFLRGGTTFTCIITTRNRNIAAQADHGIGVEEMKTDEAVRLLSGSLDLTAVDEKPFYDLARRLGEWPLLLALAGGSLRQRLRRGDTVDGALKYVNRALDRKGFTGFDRPEAQDRHEAIARTLAVSLDHLTEDEQVRYLELSVFPDDTLIPLPALGVIWSLDDFDTEVIADRLDDLSLVRFDLQSKGVRVHDVIRAYLQRQMADSGRATDAATVVRSALALDVLRWEQHRPELIFELARQGKLKSALRQPALAVAMPIWRQVALLTAAWLAAPQDLTEARDLRNRVAAEVVDPPVQKLVQRLEALPDDQPPEQTGLPAVPEAVLVSQILERLGGRGENATPIEPLTLEGLSDEAPVYLAQRDGPFLVAYAASDLDKNTAPLKQYISMLASNQYEFYRNQSLYYLLAPILDVHDSAWVQERLVHLAVGALSGSRIDFLESVAMSAAALLAVSAAPDARAGLDKLRERTLGEVEHPPQGDPWAYYLRRLASLAEIYAKLLEEPAQADKLLDKALLFSQGFAGFRVNGFLNLAESVRICRPNDQAGIKRALDLALEAAHNVQDPSFCALSTARVRAMEKKWSGPFDVSAATRRLVEQPNDAEFCPVHIVGETYERRHRGPMKLPSPDESNPSRTLSNLAELYRCSETLMIEQNRKSGWGLHTELPLNAEVFIPDRDFAPMLAARFAAEALVSVKAGQRTSVFIDLVHVASADATALDAVGARFLSDAPPIPRVEAERLAASTRIRAEWLKQGE